MFSNEKKINLLFLSWLIISLILVFFIIIIGGLTRLTDSGLSITEWELFSGILPPLSDHSWFIYFEKYKLIPQYKLLNYDMTLNEFKVIFYWEYFHRILARIIGIFFFIPLIYFYISNKINYKYIKICFLIFSLILFQGVIGWFMVKSGLVNDITVSHYRLSIHLSTAIIIISIIYWLIINVIKQTSKNFFVFSLKNAPYFFLIILIFFQIIIGAFVSGLDAGKIYQTWPLMNNSIFPNDLAVDSLNKLLEFDNRSLVQFYHRNLAYLILIYSTVLTIFIYKKRLLNLFTPTLILLFFIFFQAFLGIFTLVTNLNIYLASAHQISAVLLTLSAINLYYYVTK